MTHTPYIGTELQLFKEALNWKHYCRSKIVPLFGETILEVGAGIGESTRHLSVRPRKEWLCLEPDAEFCKTIQEKIDAAELPAFCSCYNGTTESLLGEDRVFDTILYIDVLEHLEDDRGELTRASRLLAEDGAIISIAPAHNFLYSPFDKEIGHFRRYDKRLTRKACPPELRIESMKYMDCVGMLASLSNRCLLRSTAPSMKQVMFWDNVMVPISRVLDPLLFHQLGKSLITVFRKASAHP